MNSVILVLLPISFAFSNSFRFPPEPSVADESRCEKGWKEVSFGCFQEVQDKEYISDAIDECHWMNAQLPTFHSESQFEEFKRIFKARKIWLGLKLDQNGKLFWLDGSPMDWKPPVQQAPGHGRKPHEKRRCFVVRRWGQIRPRNCHQPANVVCQKPFDKTESTTSSSWTDVTTSVSASETSMTTTTVHDDPLANTTASEGNETLATTTAMQGNETLETTPASEGNKTEATSEGTETVTTTPQSEDTSTSPSEMPTTSSEIEGNVTTSSSVTLSSTTETEAASTSTGYTLTPVIPPEETTTLPTVWTTTSSMGSATNVRVWLVVGMAVGLCILSF